MALPTDKIKDRERKEFEELRDVLLNNAGNIQYHLRKIEQMCRESSRALSDFVGRWRCKD
jgi:UDP-N-acetylglucosamine pyrophosphorylase